MADRRKIQKVKNAAQENRADARVTDKRRKEDDERRNDSQHERHTYLEQTSHLHISQSRQRSALQ